MKLLDILRNYLLDKARLRWYDLGRQGATYEVHTAQIYETFGNASEDVNTNTAESFFALLKRGVHGTFHHISKTHLHRYCDEFSFRWDERKVTDGERAVSAIKGAEGKRLIYRQA